MTIEEKVDKILDNHLPHLAERMSSVEAKVDLQGKGIVAILAGTIATFLGTMFK